ncbi:hypothetical protein O9929_09585 [Vibrio lentus]|nr:hypothetical protein [Vibrio lentus]
MMSNGYVHSLYNPESENMTRHGITLEPSLNGLFANPCLLRSTTMNSLLCSRPDE